MMSLFKEVFNFLKTKFRNELIILCYRCHFQHI